MQEEEETSTKIDISDFSKFEDYHSFSNLLNELFKNVITENESNHIICCQIFLKCEDVNNTFIINQIDLSFKNNQPTFIDIFYNVYHGSKKNDIITTLEITEFDKIIPSIFDIFWKYKLCPECLQLIEQDKSLCKHCIIHKIRQEYGIIQKYLEDHHTCMICQEPVYNIKLQCGHFIHYTCLLQLNPLKWYSSNIIPLKCSVCRQDISEHDKNKYFHKL